MSEEDINYIIDRQIKPDQFMSFIENPEFNVKNTVFYSICKTTQNAEDDFIVNFVNRYRSNFTRDTLKDLLKHYSYDDLISFYETESIVNDKLTLVPNPEKQYVILNEKTSVYKYVPADLVSVETIYVQSTMVEDLNDMISAYNKVMETPLSFESGYLSYEDSMNLYLSYVESLQENVNKFYLNAGMNEQQLGYTITISGCSHYIQVWKDKQSEVEEPATLDDLELEKISWLEENAYRYGFVIRYPEGKEDVTNHEYNPYILRYVGKDNAKKMVKKNKALEEMNL